MIKSQTQDQTEKENNVTRTKLRGVLPATITPFTADGAVDWAAYEAYLRWLASVPGVTGLVINGHAGEGSALTVEERRDAIALAVSVAGGSIPVIAAANGDGSRVLAADAKISADAGADMLLVFPAPSWVRFGYQAGAPEERIEAAHAATGLPVIAFQFPVETHAAFDQRTLLNICNIDGVVAIKDGGRNMIRWDVDVPVIRREHPEIAILTCQDEFLLHTMWEADGALVGFASLVPELMVALLQAAQSHEYDRAKREYDRLAALTELVYHRDSHIESTVAMKLGLVERGLIPRATVRRPLMPLGERAGADLRSALQAADIPVGAAGALQ
jgi:4-hydroxy-tetrahydrodipicolinate synthase